MNAPLVVGYKGEIGRFILAGLLEDMPKANDILCVDVNNSQEDVLERILKADFVFLCVPLQTTLDWLLRYREALRGKTIVEQSSIKAFLYENPVLSDLSFLSMHLLFRPSTTPLSDRRGLLFSDRIPTERLREFCALAARQFRTQFEVLDAGDGLTYQLHDKLMARHQALVHRTILCLADALQENPLVQTYVGQRISELAVRIRSGDADLYRMIQENPYLDAEFIDLRRRLDGFSI